MIQWKVVDDKRRSFAIQDKEFVLEYPKGVVVKADPATLGVFCYKRKQDASQWAGLNLDRKKAEIIKVKPIDKGHVPKCIRTVWWGKFVGQCHTVIFIPKGTICYKAVEVLT